MAEEVSSIGVKLSLNAGSFMSGMTAATERTEAFVAAAKEAQTVAGRGTGSRSGPSSSAAQRPVAVPVDLTISAAQIRSIREQIIKGIGTINVPINAQLTKAAQSEAKSVMAAVSTPAVGTRSGARVAVDSTVARNLPKRGMGGPVYANQGYLVGERRPEVFVPRQSGSIHPDASRFYREEEAAARRAATAERQHMERMRRHRGGYAQKGTVASARAAEEREIGSRTYDTYSRILGMAQQDPKQFKRSLTWYQRQLVHLQRVAGAIGMPVEAAAHSIAEISSNNPWPSNVLDLMRLSPDSWRRDPNKKLSGPLATGKNRANIWEILQGRPTAGVKKNPFANALLGDPSGIPADVWMARLSRVSLPRSLGADVDVAQAFRQSLAALHGPAGKGGEGWTSGIREVETRQIHAAVNRLAKETGFEPRGIQAALWDAIRDESARQGYFTKRPMRRAGGGMVEGTGEGLFHHHGGARPQQGFFRGALSTATDWLKDPFMAWQSWQGMQGRHGGGYVRAEEGAEIPQRYRAKSAEEHEAWLAEKIASYQAPSEDVVAEAKRIWMTMHARPRDGAYRRADEDAMLKLLIRGGEPWRERTAREAESGGENWTIERAKDTLKANAEGPEALAKLVGSGAWWSGQSAIPAAAIEYPEAFKQAFGTYSDLLEEFGPAAEAYRHKFPSKEKLSPALQKMEARVNQARRKFLKIKSQMGFSAPLDAYMHIVGGGWRWAEAERGEGPGHYGAGQVPGFWTSEEAPFRDLTEASTHARSFITDQRFENAWQHAWNEGYGGLTAPGYAASTTASEDYYSGRMTRFGGGPPEESEAWRKKYGHDPFGGIHGPSGPFKAGTLGTFPSAAEFKESEQHTALHEAGFAAQALPWGEWGEGRTAGPWPFDYLNPLEQGRYSGAAHDPVWEQSMAQAPAGWTPTAQRDFEAERKAAQVAERAKRVEERAAAKAAKKVAATATKAAREVPQHEAPTVLEHQAVMEAHAEKAIVEAVKETIAEAAPDTSGRMIGPSLFETTPRPSSSKPISEAEASARLRAIGLYRRGSGGGVGNGMYVVNEMGPEAFIEGGDVGKLRARRPDIYGRIPGARDGTKTGMIDRPAWSMFAPQKDGLIVRREDAHAALGAVRAAGGIILPGEEERARQAYARAAAYSATPPQLVGARPGFVSAGDIVSTGERRTRSPETQAFARDADIYARSINTVNAAIRQLHLPGVGGMAALGGATSAAAPMGATAAGAGPSHPVGHPYWQTPEGQAERAAFTSGGGGATAASLGAAARSAADRQVRHQEEGRISTEEYQALLEQGIDEPIALDPNEMAALRFGAAKRQHMQAREGRGRTSDELLEQMRVGKAGTAAWMSARTPRGVAAVWGEMIGGGAAFKRRQAELQIESSTYSKLGGRFDTWKDKVEELSYALDEAKRTGSETANIQERLTEAETTRDKAEKHLTTQGEKLIKAQEAATPSAGSAIKSFGSIIIATSLYGKAFSAMNMLIEQGAIPAIGRWTDEMLGWKATATATTTELGKQTYASHGNIAAVMAQTAVNAGLSRSMLDYVSSATSATAVAKAAGQAQGITSDLFRTALRGGAPEGLYGGYGGVLGSSLLGTEMGGGKGFTEQIANDITKLGGGTGVNVPGLGNVEDFPAKISRGLNFATNETFRNYILGQGQGQAGPLGPGTGPGQGSMLNFLTAGVGEAADIVRAPALGIGGLQADNSPLGAFNAAMGAAGGMIPGARTASDIFNWFAPKTPPPAPGTPGAPGGPSTPAPFVAPAVAGAGPGEADALGVYLTDLNNSINRGADAASHATTAHYRLAKSDQEITDATNAAIKAGDDYGITIAQQGVVLADNTDTVIKNGEAYEQATMDAARGKTIIGADVWAGLQKRAIEAGRQATAVQQQRQVDIELPFEMTKQLLSSPLLKPGLGFFPGAGRGAPSPGAAGLTGRAAQFAQGALGSSERSNIALQRIADEGLAAARADISKNVGAQGLADFNAANTQAEALSASIARMTTRMAGLNRAASQANWANQIRIAQRSLGDAIAMLGKAGGERLGYLQREQYLISRQQQALSLALQQRQITTQVALAGFQAPGETGEERYMRQKEKLAEASIAQQQLDLATRDFTVAGQVWSENAKRAAIDAAKAIEVMTRARDAEGYAIAAQEAIAKKQQLLAHTVGRMDSILGQARGNFNAILQAAAGGVQEFAGSVETAVNEIYTTLGYKRTKGGGWTRSDIGRQSTGYMGRMAPGYLGGFAGGATFTVGEAGPETVAILRNPRTHMLQGGGGDGGGGGAPVTININGPVVREDKDIAELARCVAEEVERTLSRKGQLLGLRSPAY